MTRFDRALVLALALMAVDAGGAAWSQAQPAGPPAGDAANGKRVYLAVGCFTCHGRAGQGGAYNAPAPVLAQTELPVEAFVAFIREPAGDMPPYVESQLPNKDAADIHAFLRSLPGRRAVRELPLLNQ
jgi:mono/diheme cytochrome c family protein